MPPHYSMRSEGISRIESAQIFRPLDGTRQITGLHSRRGCAVGKEAPQPATGDSMELLVSADPEAASPAAAGVGIVIGTGYCACLSGVNIGQ